MHKFFITSILSLTLSASIFASGINQAENYRNNSNLQWNWAMKAIDNYPWIGTERVLDVGCGDGKITIELSRILQNGYIIGLDVSPEMIQYASSHFLTKDYPRVFFMEGSATKLPFQRQFDVVVSFCAMHWVLDQGKALQSIRDSLIQGGKAIIVTPGASQNNLSPNCERLVCTEKWASYFPSFSPKRVYFTKEEYEDLLLEAGLKPIFVEKTYTETVFRDKCDFISWLNPLITFVNHLSDEMKHEFLNDLANQMMDNDSATVIGEEIHLRDVKLEILAVKV